MVQSLTIHRIGAVLAAREKMTNRMKVGPGDARRTAVQVRRTTSQWQSVHKYREG